MNYWHQKRIYEFKPLLLTANCIPFTRESLLTHQLDGTYLGTRALVSIPFKRESGLTQDESQFDASFAVKFQFPSNGKVD